MLRYIFVVSLYQFINGLSQFEPRNDQLFIADDNSTNDSVVISPGNQSPPRGDPNIPISPADSMRFCTSPPSFLLNVSQEVMQSYENMTLHNFDDNATIQQIQIDILTWAEENQLREEVLEYNANQSATTLDHQLDATRAAAQLPGIIAQLITMSQQTNISYSELNRQMNAFMDGLDSTSRMLAFPLATLFFPRPPYVGCGSVEPMPIVVTEPIQPESVQPVPIVSSPGVQPTNSTPIAPIVDNLAQAVG